VRLNTKARLGKVDNKEKISWVLSYVQRGVAKVWKDNMLEKIEKGTLGAKTMEELWEKIKEEFGEFDKKNRKMNELWVLTQGSKTYDKYIQEFKRVARESKYKKRVLVEEFK